VPVVILLAALVILGGIAVVAMGKGGELSRERPDLPAPADFRTWSDVADYRPPAALLGYHAGVTVQALALIARTIAEQDAEIDWLRSQLAEVQPERRGAGQAGPAAAGAAEFGAVSIAGSVAGPLAEPFEGPAADPFEVPAAAQPDAELPAAGARWQAGSTAGSGVAAGYSAQQPASQRFGEDE
jgi:hypothetical protein